MKNQNLTGTWNYPTQIYAGAGRIRDLPGCCASKGIQAPLFVTDRDLSLLPVFKKNLAICRSAGLDAGVFSEVKSNPTGTNVSEGVLAYQAGGHDGVIAFGGGSALDAGKAIALMAGQTCALWDLEDIGENWTRADSDCIAPVLAVPTTAGTGSEVGRASVIVDETEHVKKIIFHPRMMPSSVILDPELTYGLPPHLTAATGMDALSHNLEALCSPVWHPMAEGIALEGIRLVFEFLPRAVRNGKDEEARIQMLTASALGATAFQKGLGAMHALSHPLGALYDTHHGLLNAVLMPYVLLANQSVIGPKIARACQIMGLSEVSVDGFVDCVLELRDTVGIPHSLVEVGIDSARLEDIGWMATQDASAASNPLPFTAIQYSELCERAVSGTLQAMPA